MADGNINVSCPGCGAVFELPPEMGGEVGECTECGAIFEIPRIEAIQQGQVQKTDTGSVKVSKAPEGATNTVKLSRASIGMVPDVKDSFRFSTVKAPTGTHQAMGSTSTTKRFKNSSSSTGTSSKTRVAQAPQQKAPAGKKPWWSFLLFWK